MTLKLDSVKKDIKENNELMSKWVDELKDSLQNEE